MYHPFKMRTAIGPLFLRGLRLKANLELVNWKAGYFFQMKSREPVRLLREKRAMRHPAMSPLKEDRLKTAHPNAFADLTRVQRGMSCTTIERPHVVWERGKRTGSHF